jgi:hypothetical protein
VVAVSFIQNSLHKIHSLQCQARISNDITKTLLRGGGPSTKFDLST